MVSHSSCRTKSLLWMQWLHFWCKFLCDFWTFLLFQRKKKGEKLFTFVWPWGPKRLRKWAICGDYSGFPSVPLGCFYFGSKYFSVPAFGHSTFFFLLSNLFQQICPNIFFFLFDHSFQDFLLHILFILLTICSYNVFFACVPFLSHVFFFPLFSIKWSLFLSTTRLVLFNITNNPNNLSWFALSSIIFYLSDWAKCSNQQLMSFFQTFCFLRIFVFVDDTPIQPKSHQEKLNSQSPSQFPFYILLSNSFSRFRWCWH